jgi:rhodanese-related sulfurtransferase
VGEQRRVNYALQPMTEDDFVRAVVEGQPVRPHYFEFDARRNRELRPLLDEDITPMLLDIDEVLSRQADGAMLLDTREPADFAAGHLRGAVNVGLQGRFAEWAGDVVDAARDVVLVGDPDAALEARVRLGRIGFDRIVGQLRDPGHVFSARADLIEASSRLTIEQLAELRGLVPTLQLVDVRNPGETRGGTLPGAREIPLPVLVDSLDALARDLPVVVYCAGGYRSSIAASVLRSAGWLDVSDLLGGFGGWEGAELPVSHGAESMNAADAPEVSAGEGDKLVAAGALLLDVREPDEWNLGHAPSASLIPMGQVHDRLSEVSADALVVVVCRSGGRSAAVTQVLRSRGYDAVNLAGGMRAWAKLGLPIVTTSGAPGMVD